MMVNRFQPHVLDQREFEISFMEVMEHIKDKQMGYSVYKSL